MGLKLVMHMGTALSLSTPSASSKLSKLAAPLPPSYSEDRNDSEFPVSGILVKDQVFIDIVRRTQEQVPSSLLKHDLQVWTWKSSGNICVNNTAESAVLVPFWINFSWQQIN